MGGDLGGSQVIDLDKGLLQNVILFGEEGESKFAVNSSIEAVSRTRCNFAFTGARLQTPKLSLGLPPLGKGWCAPLIVRSRTHFRNADVQNARSKC